VSASTVAECIEKMQEDLDALSDWLKFNKLKFNVSKTKFMVITSKRSSATERALVTIDGEQIEEVQSMKYLGVQIDNKLDFKGHLNLIVQKSRQEDEFVGRISRKLTALTKTMIYIKALSYHTWIIALQLCSWLQMKTSKSFSFYKTESFV
jgi:hypothetical protein